MTDLDKIKDIVRNRKPITIDLLKQLAVFDCHKCYGRGYTAKMLNSNEVIPCKCVKKRYLEIEKMVETEPSPAANKNTFGGIV
jgi:hypothetical protein